MSSDDTKPSGKTTALRLLRNFVHVLTEPDTTSTKQLTFDTHAEAVAFKEGLMAGSAAPDGREAARMSGKTVALRHLRKLVHVLTMPPDTTASRSADLSKPAEAVAFKEGLMEGDDDNWTVGRVALDQRADGKWTVTVHRAERAQ